MKFENYLEKLTYSGLDNPKNSIWIHGIGDLVRDMLDDIKEIRGRSTIRIICKILQIPRNSFYQWLKKRIPLSIFFGVVDIWKKSCKKRTKDVEYILEKAFQKAEYFSPTTQKPIKLPKKLTRELSYLIGYIIGDGSLEDIFKAKKRTKFFKYKIKIATDTKTFAKMLVKIIKNIFGIKPTIYKKDYSNCYEITFDNKVVYVFLHKIFELPIGKKKGKLKVPQPILNAPKKIKLAFIAGLFDADGSIIEKWKFVYLSQADRKFLEEVSVLLNELNISTRSIVTYGDKRYIGYQLPVRSHSLGKFVNTVPFLHPDRIRRAANLTNMLE